MIGFVLKIFLNVKYDDILPAKGGMRKKGTLKIEGDLGAVGETVGSPAGTRGLAFLVLLSI